MKHTTDCYNPIQKKILLDHHFRNTCGSQHPAGPGNCCN